MKKSIRLMQNNDSPLVGESALPINVAFCGCGMIAHTHLEYLKQIPGVSVRACWNRQEESSLAENFKQKGQLEYCTADYRKIAEDESIDAVFICTMHNDRLRLVREFARAGKAIFMEKPLALHPHEFLAMNEILREYPVPFQAGYKIRFYSLMSKAQNELESPDFIYAHVLDSPWFADFAVSQAEIGGGHIICQGVYATEMAYLLARSEPIRVSADCSPYATGQTSGSLSAIYHFANGAIANVAVSDRGMPSDRVSKFFLTASGNGRNITLSNRFQHLAVASSSGVNQYEAPGNGLERQLLAFIHALRNQQQPECTLIDGIRPSYMIFKALEAAATGQSVPMDLHQWLETPAPTEAHCQKDE